MPTPFEKNSIFLMKNLDGKEVRYDERVFGRDENDQGSGVASTVSLLVYLSENAIISTDE